MKRNFADLEEHEALHVAIFIEERNARIYENFAQMFEEFRDAESANVAATFREMAEEERRHGTLLQERYFQRFGTKPCNLTDAHVADFIEVPQLEDGEMFILGGGLTRRKALEIALAAEQHARHYYTELAAVTVDAPLRGLYQHLASFERDHVEFLEEKLAQSDANTEGEKRVQH